MLNFSCWFIVCKKTIVTFFMLDHSMQHTTQWLSKISTLSFPKALSTNFSLSYRCSIYHRIYLESEVDLQSPFAYRQQEGKTTNQTFYHIPASHHARLFLKIYSPDRLSIVLAHVLLSYQPSESGNSLPGIFL